jgi:hypothetical protein
MQNGKLKLDLKSIHKMLETNLQIAERAVEQTRKAAEKEADLNGPLHKSANRARRAHLGVRAAKDAVESCCCDHPVFNCEF